MFYNGLNAHTRLVVDASVNGPLLSKSYNEAYEIIEKIASNNYQWLTNRTTSGRRVVRVHDVESLTLLSAHVSSISSMLKWFTTNGFNPIAAQLPSQFKAYMVKNDALIQSQAVTLKNLENQMGQVAMELSNRLQGALPSDTENPRNLGVIINLMTKSIFKLLGIGEVRPMIVKLQLVDRSLAYPEGKIKDVLVRVDTFIFPADTIALDFEADKEMSIILERPFLATGRMLIDMKKGELGMRVQDNQLTFNVLKEIKFLEPTEEYSVIEELETLISMEWKNNFVKDPL
ncbi:Retrovirus-related Pol polyprotein from transposon opus [Gossypium australe]|uniref:Retrovirus-related Pol polyprotein from transposon opus n=1 Tax=Gossypium australe TaxID=47621 RepID=A0A5B6WTE7_9ROSI|nr:Retrovirus-related Pol polyprotein from transposon opus [Gossypium australe]